MDGRGRLAQSLIGLVPRRAEPRDGTRAGPRRPLPPANGFALVLDRWARRLDRSLPSGIGLAAAAGVVLAGIGYGVVKGGHVPTLLAGLHGALDSAGNAAGFALVSVALAGNQQLDREAILAAAGITSTTSLLFLDVEQTRERLKANPWIADANVLKLYPGELQIRVKEREPFALWQRHGLVAVIADDGTVLETSVPPALLGLPLVVGSGAQTGAKGILASIDRHPGLRELVHASVLVGERRWNLRLKSGLDVLLPEGAVARALERLIALDRDKRLLSRDIVSIDLRLSDRVTVRLSDPAAQTRLEALKDKPRKKGGNA
jgi:cell division protein FtsQ